MLADEGEACAASPLGPGWEKQKDNKGQWYWVSAMCLPVHGIHLATRHALMPYSSPAESSAATAVVCMPFCKLQAEQA